jgi:transposase
MHIDIVPNRNSRPAYLLRESYREGKKVKKRTLANLSALSDAQLMAIRAVLQGRSLVPAEAAFEVISSRAHGHVQAICVAMSRLGIAALLGGRPSPERDRVLALIAARILAPHTKLATTRWWHTTTLAEEFGVADASAEDLYAAMDWLLARQDRIQKKLAKRHLHEHGLVLYDLSSSYFEGSTCPLARRGYSRDGKRGTLQVNYGLLTDAGGCPVAVSVHEGNTADSPTLLPAMHMLRKDFGIERLVMVGDRGMVSEQAIEQMRASDGIDWITALKSASIRALVEQKHLQMDLFDQRNLVEISSPDYPGERLIACRNDALARRRARKREDLLAATERRLSKIQQRVEAGRLKGQDAIGVAVGKLINQYKVAKHFALTITDTTLAFARKPERIASEAALDGLYIVRTSVPAGRLDAPACVRSYKSLANVERAFRSLKTIDLKVRPIHHRLADRVRAHIFLCMLAYYVQWHLREAWRELLFADTDLHAKTTRDPVAPAQRSRAAQRKAASRTLDDGTPAHSFATLLADLASIVRNTCRAPHEARSEATFQITTTANAQQQRTLNLAQAIHM